MFDIRRLGDVLVQTKGEHRTNVDDQGQNDTRPELGRFDQKPADAC